MSKSVRFLFLTLVTISSLVFGPAMPVLAASLPAEVNKQFTPIFIDAGGVSVLRVTIFNPNAFELTNAAWTDNLVGVQPGLKIANPANVNHTCGVGATVTAVPGTTTLMLTNGTVDPQVGLTPGECYVEVNVTSTTPGNLINTIPAGNLTSQGVDGGVTVPISNTTPASATLTVVAVSPPSLSKSFSPNTIYVGEISQLTIRINNNDTDTNLTNTAYTDTLPVGLVLATPVSPVVTNCGAGFVLNAVAGTNTVALSAATVTPTLDCLVTVNVTGVAGPYTNTIPAGPGGPGSLTTRQGVTNGSPAIATLNVQPVAITKTFSPATIIAGGTSTLTITLQNPTNSAYTNVSITDNLPAGLSVSGTPITTCGGVITTTATSVTLTGGTIPASATPPTPATCTITVGVLADLSISGTRTNTIPVNSLGTNVPGVSNLLPATSTLTINPALTATKAYSPTSIVLGGTSTVTITLTNNSATPLNGANFTDVLPANLTISGTPVSPQCNGGTITKTTSSVTLAGGSIPANSNCTITFSVTSTAPGTGTTYENTIPVGAITTAEGPRNTTIIRTGTDLTVVNAYTLPVGVSKSFLTTPIQPGATSRLRITVTAPIDVGISGITVIDNLPAGLVIAASPAPAESCPGGTLTAVAGSSFIQFTNLAANILAANTSCNIDVYVTSSVPGVYNNVIPATTITTAQGRTNSTDSNTATLTVTAMSMSKAFYPTIVQAGGFSTLVITLVNTSDSPLINLQVNDPLPGTVTNGLVVAPDPNASTTCGTGVVTALAGTQAVTLTGGVVPAQVGGVAGICTITVDVQGNDSTPLTGTTYTNIIPVANVSGISQSTGVTIRPQVDAQAVLDVQPLSIQVVKGFDPVLVYGAAYSTMSIQLINPESTVLTGIKFTDNMPTDMKLASPVMFNVGTCGGTLTGAPGDSSFTFTGGVLPANSSCILTLRVVMEVEGNLTNRIDAGDVTTFNGVSNPQPAEASLTNLPGVSVAKSFNPSAVMAGEPSTLTITITNDSNINVVDMGLIDTLPTALPTGLEIANPANAFTNCAGASLEANSGDLFITLSGGTLAGLSFCIIQVDVTSLTPGVYVNTITKDTITGTTPSGTPVTNNNPASDTLTVTDTTFSLGNRVWYDTDNSETINGTEVGINGVTVQLFAADINGDPTGLALGSQVTANGGYYRFDNLAAGDYVVVIPAPQLQIGGPLAGYWSSGTTLGALGSVGESAAPDPDNSADSDDNGMLQPSGTVISEAVTLGPTANEPINDVDVNPANPTGEAANSQSNRTVDFGFYRMQLGDQTYIDVNGNGTYDGGDNALPGALIQLYASDGSEIITGADGIRGTADDGFGPDGISGTADDSTGGLFTGVGGTYLFNVLPEGDYYVGVTPPAGGYLSTIDSFSVLDSTDPDTNINNNDNGIGTGAGQVLSATITLTPGGFGAALNNNVVNPTGTTRNPTLDFGFILPGFSLGNRVWFDIDNSSNNVGGSEFGVDNVTVQLYVADLIGSPTGPVLGTQVTANGGYYRFDNLNPGNYVVVLPASNFTSSGVLYWYWSSGTTILANSAVSEAAAPDPDNNIDNDDNGTRQIGGAFNGAVISKPITLEATAIEPVDDTNADPTNPPGEAVDNQSNRTVDFGFYRMDIGDLVFVDVDQDGNYAAGTDAPLAGAVVRLYTNNNIEVGVGPDGILGTADDMPGGVTTGAGGTYQFSGLPQGNYIAKVTPPGGFASTVDTFNPADTTDPDTNTNNNDNGIGIGSGQVASGILTMTPGEIGVNITTSTATGTTSDPSIDFGFIPVYSLGNRVWFDTDNNGIQSLSEIGIDDVLVQLYAADNAGNPIGPVLGTAFTVGGGYYRFDNLETGNYVVVIPSDNFAENGLNDALVGYWSSGTVLTFIGGMTESIAPDPDNDTDVDDNGTLQPVGDVISRAVTLGPGIVEPLLDADPVTNPLPGEAANGQSNRTVDFGFYRQQVGDQIFVDFDSDGLFTASDFPMENAIVQLYAGNGTTEIQVGPDGILGTTDDAAGGVTTLVNGTYLFSGLPAGNYIVKVTPPVGYSTIDNGSTSASNDSADPNNNLDNNDNGLGTSSGQVSSAVVTLVPGVVGLSTTVDNSTATTFDPSLDFGFVPLYSLGNRVWFDTNNNSAIDAGEMGINNVRVELYQDNGNEVYDGGDTFLSSDTTDGAGYYRFDDLEAENYVVLIPNSQFDTGGILDQYWSSGTNIGNTAAVVDTTANDPDDDTDNDDNGMTAFVGSNINYVSSQAVSIGPGLLEPISDNDPVTNPQLGESPNTQSNRSVDFGFYRVELSDQIFWDIDSDGMFAAGDVVIPDAIVKLYSGDGTVEIQVGPDGILGTADDTTGGVTSDLVSGTYFFGGLPAGNYLVRVTPPLGFSSTVDTGNAIDTATPDANIDDNDNGVGIANGEVSSNSVALIPGVVNVSNTVTNSIGSTLNPSLDFGFVPDATFEFSLGNRVWFDTDNNGSINGAEVGVANVRVDLYRDNGGTVGLWDGTDTFVDSVSTDSTGHYRFDNLPAGNYVVVILPNQFASGGPLDGYWSSGTNISSSGVVTDSADPDIDTVPTDSDDNGVTTFAGNVVNYVSSRAVMLGPISNEPIGETDALPNPDTGEEPDGQSNRTADFGFYRLQLSDLIFVDVNNDGIYNNGDLPLSDARVQIYASNGVTEINVGSDGVLGTADDAPNGVVTAANGQYLFSDLPAGDYIIRVTPPAGYVSTVDVNADTNTPNNNVNNNDNGLGVAAGQVSSNPVSLIPGVSGVSNIVTNSTGTTHNPSIDFGFNATNGFLKTIADTDQTFTTGTDVAIGEIITYQITLDLIAGTALNNVVITDHLDKGLAFVDCLSLTIDGGTAICSPVVSSITDPGDSASNPANSGRRIVFNIGNIPAPVADTTLVLQYRAIVLDVIENQNDSVLNNSATVTSSGLIFTSSAPNVRIVEPDMAIDKTATPTSNVPLGTPIQFTLTINHTSPQSTADAFDVVVTDILPATLEYIPCSITFSGLLPTDPISPAYCPGATDTLTFTWDTFPRGQTAVIRFSARLIGTPATNSASVAWTSLEIDPGIDGLPQQLSIYNSESTERWYDPNDNVNVYAVTDSITVNAPAPASNEDSTQKDFPSTLPATGFAPRVVTIVPTQPADKSYTATDIWLEIPSLRTKIPIVGVPMVNGDWDLSWLAQEAGWLDGTAFPGWDGNSALTGHVTLPNGKAGPFSSLGKLAWGDAIIIHAYGEAYTYEVRENRTIKPYITSILKHEEHPWLTLITCKTYIETTNTYADRTVVRAILVKVQKDASPSTSVDRR